VSSKLETKSVKQGNAPMLNSGIALIIDIFYLATMFLMRGGGIRKIGTMMPGMRIVSARNLQVKNKMNHHK
jgi:hypothetical protein